MISGPEGFSIDLTTLGSRSRTQEFGVLLAKD